MAMHYQFKAKVAHLANPLLWCRKLTQSRGHARRTWSASGSRCEERSSSTQTASPSIGSGQRYYEEWEQPFAIERANDILRHGLLILGFDIASGGVQVRKFSQAAESWLSPDTSAEERRSLRDAFHISFGSAAAAALPEDELEALSQLLAEAWTVIEQSADSLQDPATTLRSLQQEIRQCWFRSSISLWLERAN